MKETTIDEMTSYAAGKLRFMYPTVALVWKVSCVWWYSWYSVGSCYDDNSKIVHFVGVVFHV